MLIRSSTAPSTDQFSRQLSHPTLAQRELSRADMSFSERSKIFIEQPVVPWDDFYKVLMA